MSAIGPGDLVVSVASDPHCPDKCVDCGRIRAGRIFRVREVWLGGWTVPALELEGLTSTFGNGFCACGFRKLNDGPDDAKLIERIKRCRPAPVPCDSGRHAERENSRSEVEAAGCQSGQRKLASPTLHIEDSNQ